MEYAKRFRNEDYGRRFCGMLPSKASFGGADKPRQRLTKSGNDRVKRALHLAADVTRDIDPRLAAVYWRLMVHKGHHHKRGLLPRLPQGHTGAQPARRTVRRLPPAARITIGEQEHTAIVVELSAVGCRCALPPRGQTPQPAVGTGPTLGCRFEEIEPHTAERLAGYLRETDLTAD